MGVIIALGRKWWRFFSSANLLQNQISCCDLCQYTFTPPYKNNQLWSVLFSNLAMKVKVKFWSPHVRKPFFCFKKPQWCYCTNIILEQSNSRYTRFHALNSKLNFTFLYWIILVPRLFILVFFLSPEYCIKISLCNAQNFPWNAHVAYIFKSTVPL